MKLANILSEDVVNLDRKRVLQKLGWSEKDAAGLMDDIVEHQIEWLASKVPHAIDLLKYNPKLARSYFARAMDPRRWKDFDRDTRVQIIADQLRKSVARGEPEPEYPDNGTVAGDIRWLQENKPRHSGRQTVPREKRLLSKIKVSND